MPEALESYLCGRWAGGEVVETRLYDPVKGDELSPLRIAHFAQAALPVPAREVERGCEIEAFGGNGRKLVALDRIV